MVPRGDGRGEAGKNLTLPSLERLHRVLTPPRVRIPEGLQRCGPLGARALAQEVAVDPGNLVRQLEPSRGPGLVGEGEGGLVVPYGEIRMEVVIRKLA